MARCIKRAIMNGIVSENRIIPASAPDHSRVDFTDKMTSPGPSGAKVTVAQRSDEIIVADTGVLTGPTAVIWAIAFAIGGTGILSNQRQRDAAFAEAQSILAYGGNRLQNEVSQTIQNVKKKGMSDLAMIAVVAEKVKHVIVPFRRSDNRAPPPRNNDDGGGQKNPTCSMKINLFTQPAAEGSGGRVVYNATVQANSNGSAFVATGVEFSNRVVDPVTVPPKHALDRSSAGATLVITPAASPQSSREQPAYFTRSDVSTMAISASCSFAAPNGKPAVMNAIPTAAINGRPANATVNSVGTTVIRIPTR
jgi:hypothetical protein